jgi:hypothetical protein
MAHMRSVFKEILSRLALLVHRLIFSFFIMIKRLLGIIFLFFALLNALFDCPKPNNIRVIIYTRYPTPGTTKKRLIEAIGSERAAMLQKEMTEYIVDVTKAVLAYTHFELQG